MHVEQNLVTGHGAAAVALGGVHRWPGVAQRGEGGAIDATNVPAVVACGGQAVKRQHAIAQHRVGVARGHRPGDQREIDPVQAVGDTRRAQRHDMASIRIVVELVQSGPCVVRRHHRGAGGMDQVHGVALLLLGRSQHRKIHNLGHAAIGQKPVGAQQLRLHEGKSAHWQVGRVGPLAVVAQELAREARGRCGHHTETAWRGGGRTLEGGEGLQGGIELGAQCLGLGDDLCELHLGGVAQLAAGGGELGLQRCQRLGQGVGERALLRIAIGDHIEHRRLAGNRFDGLGQHHDIFGAGIRGDRIDTGLQGRDLGL